MEVLRRRLNEFHKNSSCVTYEGQSSRNLYLIRVDQLEITGGMKCLDVCHGVVMTENAWTESTKLNTHIGLTKSPKSQSRPRHGKKSYVVTTDIHALFLV